MSSCNNNKILKIKQCNEANITLKPHKLLIAVRCILLKILSMHKTKTFDIMVNPNKRVLVPNQNFTGLIQKNYIYMKLADLQLGTEQIVQLR